MKRKETTAYGTMYGGDWFTPGLWEIDAMGYCSTFVLEPQLTEPIFGKGKKHEANT